MSYEHGTSHYNLPQTVGSDTRDWFDTNEAFADIDAAIYSASQTAEAAAQDLDDVKSDVQGLKDADIAMTGRVDGIEGRVGASEQAIGRLEQEVADVDTDLMDAICAIKEGSATAAYQHLTGTFFWYNDTLYKATSDIGVGNQIVPDTNCKTTNITTELLEGGGGGAEIDDSVISSTKVWSSQKVNNEISPKAGDIRYNVAQSTMQYYDGTNWIDLPNGGGSMPILNYANPLHTFSSGNLTYTTTKECWLVGTMNEVNATYNNTLTIAGRTYATAWSQSGEGSTSRAQGNQICLHLGTGVEISVTQANTMLHVLEEA